MKILITLAFLFVSTNVIAFDFGNSSHEKLNERSISEAYTAIEKSKQQRVEFQGRTIAGMTIEEEKWATEFEKTMSRNDDTDYLALSLGL